MPARGMKQSNETKKKISQANLRHAVSVETRKKISNNLLGKPVWATGKKFTEKHRKNLSLSHKFYLMPEKQKEKISLSLKNFYDKGGKNHWNWQGGITKFRVKIWHSKEYKLWRETVFRRDNYSCIWCSKKGGKLEADHIKPFSLYPALRFAIDNGRTLCRPCHLKTDTYGGRTNSRNKHV